MGRDSVFIYKLVAVLLFIMLRIVPVFAQTPLRGIVIDKQSNKPIPGVTIRCVGHYEGASSDAKGSFLIFVDSTIHELEFSMLGYKTETIAVSTLKQDSILTLEKQHKEIETVEITQKTKYNKKNPAAELIDLVIKHKKENRLPGKDSLFFRQYEKLKFGLVNPEKGFTTKLGDMSFFFQNVDTTLIEGKKALSIFQQEEVSDNYIKQNPSRAKKIIIAEEKTVFDPRYINNHNIESYLNYILQPIDLYDESIYFLNKLFLSPIADNAKTYYKYFIADTLYYGNDKNIRIKFEPFNKSDLLFSGELIITMDGRYAVKYAKMSVSRESNLSWVTGLNMKLSYFKNKDGIMLQDTSQVLVQFGGGKADVLFGDRLTVNSDYDLNYPITAELFRGAPIEKGIKLELPMAQMRPIKLNTAEQNTYANVDKLNNLKTFKTAAAIGYLLTQGYYNVGKFELGPLEYLYHKNDIEGDRVRIGGRTTAEFSDKVFLQGYLAYGFRDEKIKYYLRSAVSLNGASVVRFPAHYLEGAIQHDIFTPGQGLGYLKGDGFFRSFGRRKLNKWLDTDAYRLGHLIEFGNHVSINTSFTHQRRYPIGDLQFISSGDSSVFLSQINTNDIKITLRWAPFEKFYYRNLDRQTIIENHPVFTLQYNRGLKGFFGGTYNYDAVRLSVSKRFFMNQLGFGDATVVGGRIWGTLPYPLLEIPNVEDQVDRHSISYERTNAMEFVADRFIKFAYDHKFNGFILNKIPLIKRLKLREVAGVKMFYGTLSAANNPYKSKDVVHFDRNEQGYISTNLLGDDPYWEGYVGLENVFRIFRIDYYKRFNYLNLPNAREESFWKNLRVSLRIRF